MKLRNLLFGTMIACAFVACSNEDDPIIDNGNGGGNEAAEATFSLKVAEPVATKANDALDAKISSLTVYVYNGQNLEISGNATDESGVLEVKGIKVSGGQKSIVVVANAEVPGKDAATLTGLYAAEKDYSNEVDGSLSMNSKTYLVNIQPGVTNYLGYAKPVDDNTNAYLDQNPVKLYRNVAKVNLASIQVNTEDAQNVYPNAKLNVTNIYVLHAAAKTKIVGGASAWNSTEVKGNWLIGSSVNDYAKWVGTIEEWMAKDKKNNKPLKKYLNDNYTNDDLLKATNLEAVASLVDKASAVKDVCNFYTFENLNPNGSENVHTLLVVEGTFSYGGGETNEVSSTRYYTVSVGHDKVDGENGKLDGLIREDVGVLRNLQYNISLTVKGPGYTTPFGPKADEDTFLDVKVQVVDFGYVNQNTEIE